MRGFLLFVMAIVSTRTAQASYYEACDVVAVVNAIEMGAALLVRPVMRPFEDWRVR
jgi:hypothetical protein